MLLLVIAAKPRSRAMASRSKGKPLPGQRAAAQRHHIDARPRLLQTLEIAREHLEIRQQDSAATGPAARGASAYSREPPPPDRVAPVEQRPHEPRQQTRAPRRSRRAAITAHRAIPAHCGCARCGFSPPARRPSRPACGSPACERLRRWRPQKNPAVASSRIASKAATNSARSAAVKIPTLSSARANACEPRISASIRRRSKWSDPEKRSKTSEGPSSNRPPQSFIAAFFAALLAQETPAPASAARSG